VRFFRRWTISYEQSVPPWTFLRRALRIVALLKRSAFPRLSHGGFLPFNSSNLALHLHVPCLTTTSRTRRKKRRERSPSIVQINPRRHMMCARSQADALFHGTVVRPVRLNSSRWWDEENERDGRSARTRVGNSSDALCIYRFTYLVWNYFAIVMTFSVLS